MDGKDSPRDSADENSGNTTNGELDINKITDALNDHFKARVNTGALYAWQFTASIATIVFDHSGPSLSPAWYIFVFVGTMALWLLPTLYFAYRITSLGTWEFSLQPFFANFLSKSIEVDEKLKNVLRDASLRSASISDDIKNNISTSRSMRKVLPIFFSAIIVAMGIAQHTAPSMLAIQGHLVQWHAGKLLNGQFSGSANATAQAVFYEPIYLLLLIALTCLVSQGILVDAVYAHAQRIMRALH